MKIIMLTGFGDIMAETGERPVGVDELLAKPLTLDKLRQTLVTVVS